MRAAEGLTRTWQPTELFDDLNVAENLTLAVREGTASEDVAKETLALVGMDCAAEAMPTRLSFGQSSPRAPRRRSARTRRSSPPTSATT